MHTSMATTARDEVPVRHWKPHISLRRRESATGLVLYRREACICVSMSSLVAWTLEDSNGHRKRDNSTSLGWRGGARAGSVNGGLSGVWRGGVGSLRLVSSSVVKVGSYWIRDSQSRSSLLSLWFTLLWWFSFKVFLYNVCQDTFQLHSDHHVNIICLRSLSWGVF